MCEDEEWELVQVADEALQESLETEAQFDPMNAEQTWPTEQELEQGARLL
jgi:pre-rRNA-processing protein TSR1